MWRIDYQNRSTGATCARDEATKKERKTKTETQQWQTGYSPRPPTSSDRKEILHGGWSSDDSSKIRISSKSVKRFRSCGGRNLAIPIDLAIGLYNSLYYRTSRDDDQPALCYLECDRVMAEVVKHDNNIQAIVLKVYCLLYWIHCTSRSVKNRWNLSSSIF